MSKADRYNSYNAQDVMTNDYLDIVEDLEAIKEKQTIFATRIFMERLKIANSDVENEIELYAVAAIGCIQLGLYEMAADIVFGLKDILLKRKKNDATVE